jgi:predicted GNAT family acetyltransferase
MAKKGGATGAESILWREDAWRFETPDGEAFLEYRIPSPAVMDVVHTYVPRSKRGQGLATRLCDAAFAHAREHGMRVVPTCSYVSVCIVSSSSPLTTARDKILVMSLWPDFFFWSCALPRRTRTFL